MINDEEIEEIYEEEKEHVDRRKKFRVNSFDTKKELNAHLSKNLDDRVKLRVKQLRLDREKEASIAKYE
jgi:hypothetical protein